MNDFDKQIAEIYREMELHLIQSMKRNLALHVAEEGKIGITYPQWQAIKLKELKRYQRQNKRIVDKYTRGLPKEIAQHMKDELDQGAMSQFKLHKEALGAGYKSAKLMKDSFFKVDDRAVSALIDSLQNDMATANSAILRMVNDVYRETIFKSAMFVKNGVYTEKQAYDMAIKSFLEKGINCIQYKDGRRVNIADYAEMAVRTASQRAHLTGQGEFRKEIGRTLILISRHNTACELCKPFEHKVLIDDVYSGGKPEDGDYMLLSEAMKLGLYHPRCRHGCGTYYPELEEINHYETEDNKLNEYSDDKINAAHVDNMIQKNKRLSLGSTLPENIAKYSEKLKYWESLKQTLVDKKEQNDIMIKERLRITQIRASSIAEKIDSGDYNTKMSEQQYLKHIEGTTQFKNYSKARAAKGGNPQSILLIDREKAQSIIINKAGTGVVRAARSGSARDVEDVDCGFVIGKYFGNGEYHETTKASIHYGKKSSHIVPIRGENFD